MLAFIYCAITTPRLGHSRLASKGCCCLNCKKTTEQENPMRKAIFATLATAVFAGLSGCVPPGERLDEFYIVGGVEADDMLKLRAGPGTGYRVVAGLPNGAILRVHSCQQTGGTRWCKVTVKPSNGLSGYVSWAYLREI
jgi:uncharacterized protein YgiM (DUF1202 family)